MRRLQFLAIVIMLTGGNVSRADEPASSDLRFEKLANKRAQLRALQQEVAALQRELGVAEQYQVRCVIGEIPRDKLHQFDLQVPTSEGRSEKLTAAELFGVSGTPADSRPAIPKPLNRSNSQVDAQSFQRFLDALKSAKAVKILAEPTLVVEPGQLASMHSGGEFPIPIPGKEQEANVERRKFGIIVEAKVVPVDRNAVQLTIAAEHSERDFANAVKLNGQTVPGLRTSRIQTESRMELGRTLLVGMPMQNSVRFFAVTLSEAAGSTPVR